MSSLASRNLDVRYSQQQWHQIVETAKPYLQKGKMPIKRICELLNREHSLPGVKPDALRYHFRQKDLSVVRVRRGVASWRKDVGHRITNVEGSSYPSFYLDVPHSTRAALLMQFEKIWQQYRNLWQPQSSMAFKAIALSVMWGRLSHLQHIAGTSDSLNLNDLIAELVSITQGLQPSVCNTFLSRLKLRQLGFQFDPDQYEQIRFAAHTAHYIYTVDTSDFDAASKVFKDLVHMERELESTIARSGLMEAPVEQDLFDSMIRHRDADIISLCNNKTFYGQLAGVYHATDNDLVYKMLKGRAFIAMEAWEAFDGILLEVENHGDLTSSPAQAAAGHTQFALMRCLRHCAKEQWVEAEILFREHISVCGPRPTAPTMRACTCFALSALEQFIQHFAQVKDRKKLEKWYRYSLQVFSAGIYRSDEYHKFSMMKENHWDSLQVGHPRMNRMQELLDRKQERYGKDSSEVQHYRLNRISSPYGYINWTKDAVIQEWDIICSADQRIGELRKREILDSVFDDELWASCGNLLALSQEEVEVYSDISEHWLESGEICTDELVVLGLGAGSPNQVVEGLFDAAALPKDYWDQELIEPEDEIFGHWLDTFPEN